MTAFHDAAPAVFDWLRGLARDAEVWFPQPAGSANFNFERVDAHSQLSFEGYRPSIVPPVKRLLPAREVMFEFHKDADGRYAFQQKPDAGLRVLAGVRPCDLKGIAEMDVAFADGHADPLYLRRRANAAIVAYACPHPCDERCFCGSTGAIDFRGGADVFLTPDGLTPDGDALLIEAMTPRGEQMLANAGLKVCDDAKTIRERALARRPQPFGRQLKATPEALPAILAAAYDSPVWDKYAERCYSCTTCNLVCPTCYCFEVQDEFDLDGQSGCRTRTWDACMSPAFAEVTGGHNFRAETAARHRHRVKRKFEYLTDKYGMGSFCTGCGRCGRQCTVDIDIFDMVNDIVEQAGGNAR
ncbi:MAG: 4Fe-4S dicluster domain-containing protein [Chromatiales bacterium]|nr:4Fe-4S dicluster domain-containing protein [Chromatiales bacterium]